MNDKTRIMWTRWKTAAVVAVAVLALARAGDVAAAETLILATTTSTENSGLLAHIHPDFEKKTGIRVKVIAQGTGASLQLGRDGNADVVLVHARRHEDQFIREGHGLMRRDVMYNDFVIIGPKNDPARMATTKSPGEALRRLTAGKHTFISRGDDSGTHIKEQDLWRETSLSLQTKTTTVFSQGKRKELSSVRPAGDWYLSIGQGMGRTITMATERRAYTLADRGTYYAFSLAKPPRTNLRILCQGDENLLNPYGVIAVNPKKHPRVRYAAAEKYIRWITSPTVQTMIGRYTIQGKVLFHPTATPADNK